jgi:hypothetical protein
LTTLSEHLDDILVPIGAIGIAFGFGMLAFWLGVVVLSVELVIAGLVLRR